jgi:hypothetical protein
MAITERTLSVEVRVVAELPWAWEHTGRIPDELNRRCGYLQRGRHEHGDTCGGCYRPVPASEARQYLLVTDRADTTDGGT